MMTKSRQTSDRILRRRVASDVQLEFNDIAVGLVVTVSRFGLVDARRPEQAVRFVEIRAFVVVGGMVEFRRPEGDEDTLDSAVGLGELRRDLAVCRADPGQDI